MCGFHFLLCQCLASSNEQESRNKVVFSISLNSWSISSWLLSGVLHSASSPHFSDLIQHVPVSEGCLHSKKTLGCLGSALYSWMMTSISYSKIPKQMDWLILSKVGALEGFWTVMHQGWALCFQESWEGQVPWNQSMLLCSTAMIVRHVIFCILISETAMCLSFTTSQAAVKIHLPLPVSKQILTI